MKVYKHKCRLVYRSEYDLEDSPRGYGSIRYIETRSADENDDTIIEEAVYDRHNDIIAELPIEDPRLLVEVREAIAEFMAS